jgi:hypothetical protein
MEQSENIQHKKFMSVNIVSTYCIYCPGWGGGGVQCWVDLKYIKCFHVNVRYTKAIYGMDDFTMLTLYLNVK